jgi:hypothetical protein
MIAHDRAGNGRHEGQVIGCLRDRSQHGPRQCRISGELMSQRGASAGQGRRENGVTTSLSASTKVVPAAPKLAQRNGKTTAHCWQGALSIKRLKECGQLSPYPRHPDQRMRLRVSLRSAMPSKCATSAVKKARTLTHFLR